MCDAVLITLGVFGLNALLSASPKLSSTLALAGGLFLSAYGTMSTKRAWQLSYRGYHSFLFRLKKLPSPH
ncbi:LysE family transporter [Neisseria iguanae]|uniref:Uncharacterized protein n=1 Tax=Neisseria iguanae TaxID=90242 RepID=A0A2P7TX11_9NEIS|nr:LysE family transporter [Neisseria iguanae]PSJ79247.1 hypothetical protein C7N83_13385 [Neisseria iguanae]